MNISIIGNDVILHDVGWYYDQLKETGRFKWNKRDKAMHGALCLDTMQALASVYKLPPDIAAVRDKLKAHDDLLKKERETEHPVPLVHYPIKNAELMAHQIRGANLAAIQFGLEGS